MPDNIDVTPDGRHAVLADGGVVSVLGPKAKVLRVLDPKDGASRAAISPDGTVVAVSGASTSLVALYGVATAFFTSPFEAIVPDIVPSADLPAANSLDQFVRPAALRLVIQRQHKSD